MGGNGWCLGIGFRTGCLGRYLWCWLLDGDCVVDTDLLLVGIKSRLLMGELTAATVGDKPLAKPHGVIVRSFHRHGLRVRGWGD